MNANIATLKDQLSFLYGPDKAELIFVRLMNLLDRYSQQNPLVIGNRGKSYLDEKDAILIAYADHVQEKNEPGLKTLHSFLNEHMRGVVNTVHLLPFFPSSSDDGFSVIDYRLVDRQLGTWDEVTQIGKSFRLMFDAVINHMSSKSNWFQGVLEDKKPHKDYFIVVPDGTDVSETFRPRALPLLTKFDTRLGSKNLWTTFSGDQIDLNYGNPDVLLDIIDLLLFYVSKGAKFIRLDAIAYLWKEVGTRSIHLPQTHCIVQLFRSIFDMVAPAVQLITETNVPHQDNICYFGNGYNEAQLIYNFSLPPLTLHAFHEGNAEILTSWASTLSTPSNRTAFFNFTASHDGIGLLAARDFLGEQTIQTMATRIQSMGGYVSYKDNADGSRSPYELNINYLEALSSAGFAGESVELVARRFLSSQAIMLALKGVPGIYFHSLVGSKGWPEGVSITGRSRTINREKLNKRQLEDELSDPSSLRYHIFRGYSRMLKTRSVNPAFDPGNDQQVLNIDRCVFALLRSSIEPTSRVLCLHNVSELHRDLNLDLSSLGLDPTPAIKDLISGRLFHLTDQRVLRLTLHPYDVLWLEVI